MLKILCFLFGHTIEPYTYGKFWGGTIDGIGRIHDFYNWKCKRCGEPVSLYVHRQQEEQENIKILREHESLHERYSALKGKKEDFKNH
jgi:hypothetical protein